MGNLVGQAPCKDCANRCVGCHGNCKFYGEWKDAHEVAKERIRQERKVESDLYDERIARYNRRLRKRAY